MLKVICHKCHWKGGVFMDQQPLSEVSCPRCFNIGFLLEQDDLNLKVNYQRSLEFLKFTSDVIQHIENYTIHQYGDAPDDQISEWSAADCIISIKKRVSRHGRNSRKGQDKLDLLKIAHEACIAYFKLKDYNIPYDQSVNVGD